jgi:hypothetical protein
MRAVESPQAGICGDAGDTTRGGRSVGSLLETSRNLRAEYNNYAARSRVLIFISGELGS